MKPTILLTGKTGQLGSELNRLLPKLGKVIAPERKDLDLLEPEQIRLVMQDVKPQLVVNAAAYTAVDAAEADESNALAVNAEAPRLLALEAKKLGAILVHFSTDYVFDGSKKAPYVETDSPNPLNAYGRTKLAGEQAILNSGASHLIFRTSWVYATHGRNFLLTILRLATEREELRVVDDQVGAPTCASDLAVTTTRILAGMVSSTKSQFTHRKVSGIYHMTAAGQATWYEFAKAILEEARRAPLNLPWLTSATNARPLIGRCVLPISTEEFRSPTRRPAYSVLSNTRLLQAFGVSLSDWRTQLQRCFSSESIPSNLTAALSSP
ncbi:MAG TPA: dTDP-4-dehydrorhamnose reductase [Candidatus Dormibacteraeota bacterium]|nr:dTDP-4-dehydrorhamnose reductase [Candidatus Dormibacteraeota bacterium]